MTCCDILAFRVTRMSTWQLIHHKGWSVSTFYYAEQEWAHLAVDTFRSSSHLLSCHDEYISVIRRRSNCLGELWAGVIQWWGTLRMLVSHRSMSRKYAISSIELAHWVYIHCSSEKQWSKWTMSRGTSTMRDSENSCHPYINEYFRCKVGPAWSFNKQMKRHVLTVN